MGNLMTPRGKLLVFTVLTAWIGGFNFACGEVSRTPLSGYEFELLALSADSNRPMPMQSLRLWRGDSVVWQLDEHLIRVLSNDSLHLPSSLIRDSTAEVMVETYSGGAHCCFAYYMLRLGMPFSVLDTIHGAARFETGADGRVIAHVNDYVFDCWQMPHSDSPLPEVIMRFSSGKFCVAPELMRQPAPDTLVLHKAASEIRALPGWTDYPPLTPSGFLPPPLVRLTAEMVRVIYTGNADAARELAQAAWPKFLRGEADFVTALFTQLAKSPYYGEIRKLNDL